MAEDSDVSTRQATTQELSDSLIRTLVSLLIEEPEAVSEMIANGCTLWQLVENWHLFNNCLPLAGLQERLAEALG